MKKDLHPAGYRTVVVQDISNGWQFVTKSTAATEDTIKWEDGNEYPLVKVHISSSSHPFYTGQEKLVDVEGRVDRFKARADAAKAQREKLAQKAAKTAKRSEREEAKQTKIGDRKYNVKPKAKKQDKPEAASEKPKAEKTEDKSDDK